VADAHEVAVLCNCGAIEHCRMERYVSDVRLLETEMREEFALAFVLGTLIGGILSVGGLLVWFAVKWKWY
jgi:hypothetical protein